jgi:hypothetical protein
VVLALGFPTLSNEKANREGSQSLDGLRIGDPVIKLLLQQLHESLKEVSTEGVGVTNTFGRPKKESEENRVTNAKDEEDNPYHVAPEGEGAMAASKIHMRMGMYLQGGVFASVHHHLALLIEVRAENRRSKAEDGDDDDDDLFTSLLAYDL